MRLIACPDCHTQYDVTATSRAFVVCRCGSEIPNHVPAAMEVAVQRCGSCSAQIDSRSTHCDYCGSAIDRDRRSLSLICPTCCARNAEAARFCTGCGVAFEPQMILEDGKELPCPDCMCLMPVRSIGGLAVNECPRCNGIWAPEDRFEELIRRATEAQEAGAESSAPDFVARVKGASPAAQGIKYRKCPECDAFMARKNFERTSGVVIDRCGHGVWLDVDELEQIAGFLLSGGRPQATRALEDGDRRAEAEFQKARLATYGSTSIVPGSSAYRGHSDAGSAALSFFVSLFD